jgi:AcrR family transcriptional regulator
VLFSQRGYHAVTLEEIAACVGIEGPTIYHHIPNKVAILSALVNRLNEWLTLAPLEAQRGTDGDGSVLNRLACRYVELALGLPQLITVTVDESIDLPADEAEHLLRRRSGINNDWAALLRRIRPELPDAVSLIVVHAASAAVDEVVRLPSLYSEMSGNQLTAVLRAVHHS